MTSLAPIRIHASQFPENIRRDLLVSLRTRQVNHKFHYDSVKQTQKWLALHQAYSPSRTDDDCQAIYEQGFAAAAARVEAQGVHLIGLGCGGGQKDRRLLELLRQGGKALFYTPVDVSSAMVLVARQMALEMVGEENCFPLVCDLATAEDLPQVFEQWLAEQTAGASAPGRLITFFGMIPNFEPQMVLPRLAGLVRPDDLLLFSANLAPGQEYEAGVRRILPLYDNELTRDWLMAFLLDLGVEKRDGTMRFGIEADPAGSGLRRVAAYFDFTRPVEIAVETERFAFASGESIRLFFSYRHTPARIRSLLGEQGLGVMEEWITRSEEEGVFLVRRQR